jgi:Ni/Co efflux regulator RcnB
VTVKFGTLLVGALWVVSGAVAIGQEQHEHEHGGQPERATPRPEAHPPGEPHRGPQGYQRVNPPEGWNKRPPTADRDAYRHNFQAARAYHIGPYHRPAGWAPHRWSYGQILPRVYWGPQYLIADYWLFSLEVPPAGYEWVRDDSDAVLIDINTGEILQVEYGVFG